MRIEIDDVTKPQVFALRVHVAAAGCVMAYALRLIRRAALMRVASIVVAIAASTGCSSVEARYSREIVFDELGAVIVLEDGRLLRCDGAVVDMDKHQAELLEELGVENHTVRMSNPGRYGRQFALSRDDGTVCSFIWALDDPDPLIVEHRLNHEKFHALCALQPMSIITLNEAIRGKGYAVDLRAVDEELAATIVGVLTLYAGGREFVFGSADVMDAVRFLEHARIERSEGDA